MLSIRSNIAALTAQRGLASNQALLDQSLERLSSGFRITSAAEDAAGLGRIAKLTAEIRSFNQAARNADDGLSVAQIAEGALNEVTNILTSINELAEESASDGVSSADRAAIAVEATALLAELDRIDDTTEFNGRLLFELVAPLVFQVGIRATASDTLSVDTTGINTDAVSLGVSSINLGLDASTSQASLAQITAAINTVSTFRAGMGAAANRFISANNTISANVLDLTSALSNIADVDVAAETTKLSSAQILVQVGTSVLVQANISPSVLLRLFE
jgi:flagellin